MKKPSTFNISTLETVTAKMVHAAVSLSYNLLSLDSGSFSETRPPSPSRTTVSSMGMALLTSMKLPKATFPRMAAIRPRQDRKPNAVDLQ